MTFGPRPPAKPLAKRRRTTRGTREPGSKLGYATGTFVDWSKDPHWKLKSWAEAVLEEGSPEETMEPILWNVMRTCGAMTPGPGSFVPPLRVELFNQFDVPVLVMAT